MAPEPRLSTNDTTASTANTRKAANATLDDAVSEIEKAKEYQIRRAEEAEKAAAEKAEQDKKERTRTWADATGEYTVHAEFRGYTAGKVKLKKDDGTVVTLEIDKLSEEDQKWIKSRR